jgi:release factor glutamine methyltransferase
VKDAFGDLLARVRDHLRTLPDKPEETPEATLRALWHAALGEPKSTELAGESPLPPLAETHYRQLDSLLERRFAGVPLAHLTGRQRFLGIEMLAGPEALIPRKETELLAKTAIDLLAACVGPVRVLDVCTGSGNVALAIASRVPGARVYACDLSPEALGLARRNAQFVGIAHALDFRAGDLLAPFDAPEFHGSVDLVSCNPPYIASANVERMPEEISRHEPRLAFDGGPFGVGVLMRLMREAPRFLRPSGWLVCEVGLGQAQSVTRMLEKHPDYTDLRSVADHNGAGRVVAARRR